MDSGSLLEIRITLVCLGQSHWPMHTTGRKSPRGTECTCTQDGVDRVGAEWEGSENRPQAAGNESPKASRSGRASPMQTNSIGKVHVTPPAPRAG